MIKDKRIQILVAIFAAAGGLVAVLKYLEDKEHRETLKKIAELDKEIKQEQLRQIKNER